MSELTEHLRTICEGKTCRVCGAPATTAQKEYGIRDLPVIEDSDGIKWPSARTAGDILFGCAAHVPEMVLCQTEALIEWGWKNLRIVPAEAA